jgi:hypothetical protein
MKASTNNASKPPKTRQKIRLRLAQLEKTEALGNLGARIKNVVFDNIMKKMKKLYYFVVLIAIIAIASVIYTLTSEQSPSENAISPIPDSGKSENPGNSEKIKVATDKGPVFINDIEKNPIEKIAYDSSVVFGKSDNFTMSYYPPDQGFIITIDSPALEQSRQQAEKNFLDLLGVSKEQACLLKVTLNVPYNVSEAASGQNYGLSFCPNGKPFPKK